MHIRPWLPVAAVLILAQATGAPLLGAASRRTHWDLRRFTWVNLERREPGSALNAHPLRIAPAALRRMLTSVVLAGQDESEPLFAEDELDRITGPLCEALGTAQPDEDVVLFSTFKHASGFAASGLTITARIFCLEGRLQFIVNQTRMEYAGPALAEAVPPMPAYGSRLTPGQATLRAPGALSPRPDWLAFSLEAAAPQPAPAPILAVAPAPAAAPEHKGEDRLRNLKYLRDQNLITEQEYEKKRLQVLEDL